MITPTRPNRVQSFTPLRGNSLRRLKTAFSPTRSLRSASPSSSTGTTSPLTRTSSPDAYGSPNSHRSRGSMNSIRHLLALRRKPSVIDLELEEEMHLFSHELEMLEPRPKGYDAGRVEVGIFEVLDGKC